MSREERKAVSRRVFLSTVGGLAAAVGILGSYAVTTTAGIEEPLRRELVRLRSSNEYFRRYLTEKKIASGGGVLNLTMLDFDRKPNVPLTALFAFDPTFLLFTIPGNREAFLLPTHSLGELRVERDTFNLSLFGSNPRVTFLSAEDGRPMAEIEGTGACGVSLTENRASIAGIEVKESVKFVGRAVASEDAATQPPKFSLELAIRETESPNLFSIFGAGTVFDGKLMAGKITLKEISRLPI